MPIQIVILNGGSSSGKSSIARALQGVLPEPWLTFGVDDFVDALPPAMQNSKDGLVFLPNGGISVGPGIRRLREAWECGIAGIAGAGVGVIIDDVFLSGGAAQERWRAALRGRHILWVGVRCEPVVAARREAQRGDRVPGMAASQAELVHRGVAYDLAIDSTNASPEACARLIVDRIANTAVTS
ncbi:MAG TPA: chloramphenicol phosphotransferase [Acetobacteraceae bacterium]|nr:chloramphenicol phosphotransferase [Acetobacteraceae bacterium]